MQRAQVAQDEAFGTAIADLARDREGLLVMPQRFLHLALFLEQAAEVAEDDAFGAAVADLAWIASASCEHLSASSNRP